MAHSQEHQTITDDKTEAEHAMLLQARKPILNLLFKLSAIMQHIFMGSCTKSKLPVTPDLQYNLPYNLGHRTPSFFVSTKL